MNITSSERVLHEHKNKIISNEIKGKKEILTYFNPLTPSIHYKLIQTQASLQLTVTVLFLFKYVSSFCEHQVPKG